MRVLKEELEKKQSEGNQQDIIDIRRQLEEAEGKLRKQLEGVESREDIIQAIEYDLSEFNMSFALDQSIEPVEKIKSLQDMLYKATNSYEYKEQLDPIYNFIDDLLDFYKKNNEEELEKVKNEAKENLLESIKDDRQREKVKSILEKKEDIEEDTIEVNAEMEVLKTEKVELDKEIQEKKKRAYIIRKKYK